ncbi:MAG TPA: tetratricopeptide repeat protein [Chloroflexia bacterium]|nr:tetratricopeptide repeat protein [Chloroflexia bacterium]
MANQPGPGNAEQEAALLARFRTNAENDERRKALKALEEALNDLRLRLITEPEEAHLFARELLNRLQEADSLPGMPLDEKWQRRRDALEMSLTNFLAQALVEIGDWAGAAATYEYCLDLGARFNMPEFRADSLIKLGRAYRHAGDLTQAREAFEGAARLSGNHALPVLEGEALYQQAVVAELEKRVPDAYNLYGRGLELSESQRLYPLCIRFLSQLGQLHQSEGHFQPALEYYRRCLQLLRETDDDKESETIILGQISHICAQLDAYDDGIDAAEEGLKLSRTTGQKAEEEAFLNDLARLYRRRGSLPLARVYAEQSLDRARKRGDRQSAAIAYDLLQRITEQELEEKTTGTFTIDPSLDSIDQEYTGAEAYYRRGNRYYHEGAFDRAISSYNRALWLDSQYISAYVNRGSAYTAKGDYDRALADYTRAIELAPSDAVIYFNRGNAYRKRREYKRALADYTRAIELAPADPDAYFNRGEVLRRMKRTDEAASDFRKVIALSAGQDEPGAQQARKLLSEISGQP